MSVSAKNVLVGAPDQATTGAILSGPGGTPVPESLTAALNAALKDSGYVSEDGLTLTPERSVTGIKDWSGAIVRQLLEEFSGKLAWAHLETNEQSLRNYFGDDNVTVTPADATNGQRITAKFGAFDLPRKAWVFRMKDGKARVMIVVPDGQVIETGEVAFVSSGAITWPVTLQAYPDATGTSIYVYFDDGQVLTAAIPTVTAATPSGAAAGAQVTITGSRFTGTTGVKFAAAAATSFTVVNDSTIVAVVPAGSAGSAPIVVTNGVGPSTALAYTRA